MDQPGIKVQSCLAIYGPYRNKISPADRLRANVKLNTIAGNLLQALANIGVGLTISFQANSHRRKMRWYLGKRGENLDISRHKECRQTLNRWRYNLVSMNINGLYHAWIADDKQLLLCIAENGKGFSCPPQKATGIFIRKPKFFLILKYPVGTKTGPARLRGFIKYRFNH